jgi:GPH family glycoside/pentoside/hexuronide:cation symporter
MTSDVLDIDELKTGKRREGVFGAIYWWMVKLGFAIAGGLSGLILTLVNYKGGDDVITQPEGAVDALRIVFSGLPILCALIAIAVMWNYRVDENYAKEVRAELDKRKETQA